MSKLLNTRSLSRKRKECLPSSISYVPELHETPVLKAQKIELKPDNISLTKINVGKIRPDPDSARFQRETSRKVIVATRANAKKMNKEFVYENKTADEKEFEKLSNQNKNVANWVEISSSTGEKYSTMEGKNKSAQDEGRNLEKKNLKWDEKAENQNTYIKNQSKNSSEAQNNRTSEKKPKFPETKPNPSEEFKAGQSKLTSTVLKSAIDGPWQNFQAQNDEIPSEILSEYEKQQILDPLMIEYIGHLGSRKEKQLESDYRFKFAYSKHKSEDDKKLRAEFKINDSVVELRRSSPHDALAVSPCEVIISPIVFNPVTHAVTCDSSISELMVKSASTLKHQMFHLLDLKPKIPFLQKSNKHYQLKSICHVLIEDYLKKEEEVILQDSYDSIEAALDYVKEQTQATTIMLPLLSRTHSFPLPQILDVICQVVINFLKSNSHRFKKIVIHDESDWKINNCINNFLQYRKTESRFIPEWRFYQPKIKEFQKCDPQMSAKVEMLYQKFSKNSVMSTKFEFKFYFAQDEGDSENLLSHQISFRDPNNIELKSFGAKSTSYKLTRCCDSRWYNSDLKEFLDRKQSQLIEQQYNRNPRPERVNLMLNNCEINFDEMDPEILTDFSQTNLKTEYKRGIRIIRREMIPDDPFLHKQQVITDFKLYDTIEVVASKVNLAKVISLFEKEKNSLIKTETIALNSSIRATGSSSLQKIKSFPLEIDEKPLSSELWLEVRGYQEDIDDLKKWISNKVIGLRNEAYPQYWDFSQNDHFQEYPVAINTNEYKYVEELFMSNNRRIMPTQTQPKANPKTVKILKINRVQNQALLEKYVSEYFALYKVKEYGPARAMLFHGTGDTEPSKIYTSIEVGFDARYADVYCAWGKGAYFASDSSYCIENQYCYKLPNGNSAILLAEVILGEIAEVKESYVSSKMMAPPEHKDSVQGQLENHEIFVIYYPHRSYPLYYIEFI